MAAKAAKPPSLRIVAGKYRGRRLVAPAGPATRPTGARVREAVFDIIAHGLTDVDVPDLGGARVLDMFAGAGAMGFEALSRGAAFATFLENAGPARRAIEQNAAALGVGGAVRILNVDATNPPPARDDDAAGVAFLDPPYRQGQSQPALAALAARGWLAASALVVVEHGIDETVTVPAGFADLDRRSYGPARLLFLRFDGRA